MISAPLPLGLGIVVIGRNEGQRLIECLASMPKGAADLVYVDSGSTDESAQTARALGFPVVVRDPGDDPRRNEIGDVEFGRLQNSGASLCCRFSCGGGAPFNRRRRRPCFPTRGLDGNRAWRSVGKVVAARGFEAVELRSHRVEHAVDFLYRSAHARDPSSCLRASPRRRLFHACPQITPCKVAPIAEPFRTAAPKAAAEINITTRRCLRARSPAKGAGMRCREAGLAPTE